MCGVVGFWSHGRPEQTRTVVRDMIAASHHRGPDASGSVEIPLDSSQPRPGTHSPFHPRPQRRLAPAHARCRLRFLAHLQRRNLQLPPVARGAGSLGREILAPPAIPKFCCARWSQWGEAALTKLEGMFAFAFWDGRERTLLLARDRMGIKPLYYCRAGRDFAFASEVKALERAHICPLTLDRDAVDSFLAYGAVIGPNTIFQEIRELGAWPSAARSQRRPGSRLRVLVAQPATWRERLRQVDQDFEQAVAQIRERLALRRRIRIWSATFRWASFSPAASTPACWRCWRRACARARSRC